MVLNTPTLIDEEASVETWIDIIIDPQKHAFPESFP